MRGPSRDCSVSLVDCRRSSLRRKSIPLPSVESACDPGRPPNRAANMAINFLLYSMSEPILVGLHLRIAPSNGELPLRYRIEVCVETWGKS
jgi:hypothetical protein